MTKVNILETKFSRAWKEGNSAKFHSLVPASGGDGMISKSDLDNFLKKTQLKTRFYIVTYKEPGSPRWYDCFLDHEDMWRIYKNSKIFEGKDGPYFHIKWSWLSSLSSTQESPGKEQPTEMTIKFKDPNPKASTIAALLLSNGVDPKKYFIFDGAGVPIAFKV